MYIDHSLMVYNQWLNRHSCIQSAVHTRAYHGSAEKCREVQRSAEKCRDVQRSAEISEMCREVQRCAEKCRDVQRSAEMCRDGHFDNNKEVGTLENITYTLID